MTQPPPPGNPVFFPQTGLSGPLPGAIADLDSIARDIAFTRNCADSYLASFSAVPQDDDAVTLTRQALWFAGVISYRRAFTSGRGHLVAKGSRIQFKDAWKEVLDQQQQSAHDEVLQQANQHIAHRVAEHEGAVVVGILAPPPQPKAVAGVGTMLAVYVGPTAELAQQLTQSATSYSGCS